jgi:D-3-phosphoglycerate dehydrogenase
MTPPVRIVSTSDRYDMDWERTNFTDRAPFPIDYHSVAVETSSELVAAGQGAKALLIGAREAITEDVLTALPELVVIGRLSVGLDNIDLEAATRHHVLVTHYPQYCTNEVADHAIAMIYALNRNLVGFDRTLRAGSWNQNRFDMAKLLDGGRIRALRTLTLGIIGLGRIGQTVARRMQGSVGRIIAYDPYVDLATAAGLGVELVYREAFFRSSDIVTLHCPLTPETRHLIYAETLALMPSDAMLVNTARGPIIDGVALYNALTTGQIAAAAIDVFEEEPLPMDDRLFTVENIIHTPHAAYYSEQSADTIRIETLGAVIDVLNGREPIHTANPAVLRAMNLLPFQPRA